MDERLKRFVASPRNQALLSYAAIFCFAFVVFSPVALHIFSFKNDALTYFLPYRHQVSEAIRAHQFPFWSPYLYLGLPLHADIQSGVWNPVVFLLSLVRRYDMGLLQWEFMLYILIAGISFHRLCTYLRLDAFSALTLSFCYMAAGFIVDSGSFIPWITAAAYLPFVITYFLKTLATPSWPNAIKLGGSMYLLFVAGYMSFFIITTYLLLFISIATLISTYKQLQRKDLQRHLLFLGAAALICLLLSSPALLSYIEFLPYYSRGRGMTLTASLVDPFGFDNSLSYLFPPASYKLDTANDITSRNAYIGLFPLVFLIYSLKYRFSRIQNYVAAATILCFLLSLGGTISLRAATYYVLPFMDSFRHPANFRLFTSIGLLLLGGMGMKQYVENPDRKWLRNITIGFFVVVILFAAYYVFFQQGIYESKRFVTQFDRSGKGFKHLLESSQLSFWLLAAAFVQAGCLILFLLFRRNWFITLLTAGNLVALTYLCMPFTLLSQFKTHEVNGFVFSFPIGYPLEEGSKKVLNPVNDMTLLTGFGYRSFYDKHFSIQDHQVSPTLNDSYAEVMKDTAFRNELSAHRVAWFSKGDSVGIYAIRPNEWVLTPANAQADTLHLVQQYNSHWKATADDNDLRIEKDHGAFMKVLVPARTRVIHFRYQAPEIWVAICISFLSLLGCIGTLIYFERRRHAKKN